MGLRAWCIGVAVLIVVSIECVPRIAFSQQGVSPSHEQRRFNGKKILSAQILFDGAVVFHASNDLFDINEGK